MDPMYLPEVENNPSPGGAYAELGRVLKAAGHPVPQIFHLFAFKPEVTQHLEQFTHGVMRGPSALSPGFRELIATLTSKTNDCDFCRASHAAVSLELLSDKALVAAVLEDLRSAPLTHAEKALLVFVEKLTRKSSAIGRDDVEALRRAGWSDQAIYDAVTVCALFNFFNRWIHGTGVREMTAEDHARSGRRLAERGYVVTQFMREGK